jgi:uncharacterized protein
MEIALIGAGYVGGEILKEALARGHQVKVIVRHPEKIAPHPGVTAVKGDVFDVDGLARALQGQDAVISAYNPGASSPDAHDLQLKGTLNTMAAAQKAGVRRFLVVGGAGSLEVSPGVQLVDTPHFPPEWKNAASGLRDALTEIRKEKDLDWTFFSPAALLQPGERTGKFRLGGDQLLTDEKGPGRISTADYAVAMLDELENPKHIRRRFTAAY